MEIILTCGACGSPAVLRENKNGGSFFGCSSYPRCQKGGTVTEEAFKIYKNNFLARQKENLIFDAGPNYYHKALSKRAKKVMEKVALKRLVKQQKEDKQTISIKMHEVRNTFRRPEISLTRDSRPTNQYGLSEERTSLW
jgi:ssDNA-binding Zn-finger/Zn-ribbon topoisomerase 1